MATAKEAAAAEVVGSCALEEGQWFCRSKEDSWPWKELGEPAAARRSRRFTREI